jgi:hypothetical protein
MDRLGLSLAAAARADQRTCGWGWHPPPHETKAGPMLLTSTQLDAPSPGSWQSERKSAVGHPTSPASENKTHYQFVEWVRLGVTALVERLSWRVAAVGARLYAVDDRTAIQEGWTVTRRRGGLARAYRDPRFDTPRGPTRRAEQGQPAPFEGQRS